MPASLSLLGALYLIKPFCFDLAPIIIYNLLESNDYGGITNLPESKAETDFDSNSAAVLLPDSHVFPRAPRTQPTNYLSKSTDLPFSPHARLLYIVVCRQPTPPPTVTIRSSILFTPFENVFSCVQTPAIFF